MQATSEGDSTDSRMIHKYLEQKTGLIVVLMTDTKNGEEDTYLGIRKGVQLHINYQIQLPMGHADENVQRMVTNMDLESYVEF